LAAAHLVLVPVKTDLLSILGIPLLLREIEDIRARDNRGLQVFGVLPTMYNKQYRNDNETLESLRAILQEKQIPLLDPIPRSTQYDKAASNGKPLILSSSNAPGADVFYTLADKIINHHG
jgi:chromosome partitioning protein